MVETRPTSTRQAALALCLLVPVPSLGVAAAMIVFRGPVGHAIFIVTKLWVLVLPAAWWILVQRQRPSLSPLKRAPGVAPGVGPGVARPLLTGLVTGLIIAAIITAAYWFLGRSLLDLSRLRAAAVANGIARRGLYVGMALYMVLVNSLLEEYVWRWFVFENCRVVARRLAPGFANALSVTAAAIFFTLHHILALAAQAPWRATALASVGVFIGGATWSCLYLRYRSIWPGYVSHVLADVPIFVIGWYAIFG